MIDISFSGSPRERGNSDRRKVVKKGKLMRERLGNSSQDEWADSMSEDSDSDHDSCSVSSSDSDDDYHLLLMLTRN